MKKAFLLCFLLAVFLCACRKPASQSNPTTASTTEAYTETTVPETIPTEAYIETTVPPTVPTEISLETEPLHSEFYIPGVSVEDVILYFNEVCLQAEFVNSGNPTVLQKWTSPIYYTLNGVYTGEDFAVFSAFTDSLNAIPGFPGISEIRDPRYANLSIFFCDEESMASFMGDQFRGMDGAVTFWYDGSNAIYNAIVCCRTDIDQYLRNSVILEELYNCLGPVQDTSLRPDSIIYSDFSEPQEPTQIDWLILKLLYHPTMECGMDAQSCEAVIRSLYY